MTSLSYVPQVRKALPANSTEDLSMRTLLTLAVGLALWLTYGLLKGDYVIVTANCVCMALVLTLIGLKVRDSRRGLAAVTEE